jgi:hypothetical protein
MTKYLRKKGTNEIFAWSEIIAQRKDMIPYDGPVPATNGLIITANDGEEDIEGTAPKIIQQELIDKIIDVIPSMRPEDMNNDGSPKASVLSDLLGIKITKQTKDAAWNKYVDSINNATET